MSPTKLVPQRNAGNPRVLARFDEIDEELGSEAEMAAEMEFVSGAEAKRELVFRRSKLGARSEEEPPMAAGMDAHGEYQYEVSYRILP